MIYFFAPAFSRYFKLGFSFLVFCTSSAFGRIGEIQENDPGKYIESYRTYSPTILQRCKTKEYTFNGWTIRQASIQHKTARIQYIKQSSLELDDLKWIMEREGQQVENWIKTNANGISTLVAKNGNVMSIFPNQKMIQLDSPAVKQYLAISPYYPFLYSGLSIAFITALAGSLIYYRLKDKRTKKTIITSSEQIEAYCDFTQRQAEKNSADMKRKTS